MGQIKDETLIISNVSNEQGSVITIKDGVMLSMVFNHLPSGLVIKDETGMGATFLELTSERPSIIVEPLKYTASSKAHHHGTIYFGSETLNEKKPTNKELKDILVTLPPHKRKILVVADSLKKLKKILGKDLKDYFLLIDEADSFQLDSTFRSSMGDCMDIYKDHPKEMRAMLTATPLDFSDEVLRKEATTFLRYENPKLREIELIHCDNVNGVAKESIVSILDKYPSQKILVAYNNVTGCVDIANYLVQNKILSIQEIKILCSTSDLSKKRAGVYFHELNGNTLPQKVNFITSAYFTGFDLIDDYHQISLSDIMNPIFLLSDKRLKQIAGRCRKKLLSETVIYSTLPSSRSIPLIEDMIEAAKTEITALNCITKNYIDVPLLEIHLLKIRKYILNYTQDNDAPFVRENINGELVINYLGIDASQEAYRVKKNLFNNQDQLKGALINIGHEVHFSSMDSDIKTIKNETTNDRKTEVNQLIESILSKEHRELDEEFHTNVKLPLLESKMIETYLEFSPYLDQDSTVTILNSLALRDDRQFTRLKMSADFFLRPEDDIFKSRVLKLFKTNVSYSREELFKIWNQIFSETGMALNNKKFDLSKVVPFTNIFFSTTKDRRGPKGFPLKIKIIRTNPDGFVSKMTSEQEEGKFNLYNSRYKKYF